MTENFFSPDGRITRTTYWSRWLIAVLFSIAGTVIQTMAPQLLIVGAIISLGAAIFILIEGVKRMHDVDKSGWYIIIPIYNLILLLSDGTRGQNHYGLDPKNRNSTNSFSNLDTLDVIPQFPAPSMANTVLKWGLIISFALVANSIIVYLAGMSTNKAIGWINYILMFVGVVFATKVYRDEKCGGYIAFGSAFKFGFLTLFLVGIITAIYTYIFFAFIAPELTGQILTQMENEMLNKGQSEEEIEMIMGYTKKFMTPVWMVTWVVVGSVFMGAIFSLISAAILKKENQELQPPV